MTTAELRIEKPVYGGYGLAFIERKAIFVENALPGETVLAHVHDERKDHAFARTESIIEASPHRIEASCPAFGRCGGCSYLCLSYEKELEYKSDIVTDSLRRIGGLGKESLPAMETVSSGRFNYRSHGGIKVRDGRMGFFRRESNELEPMPAKGCLLLDEGLNQALADIEAHEDFSIAIDADGHIAASFRGDTFLTERELGITYRRGIGNFFQANRLLRSRMLEIVGGYAGPGGDEFMDIACGVGFFSLHLARTWKRGHGIDISRQSIEMARRNAAENGLDNVSFSATAASNINPGRHRCDSVIVDPPRAGLDKKTRYTISAMEPQILVYVSCNPATFARDAKDFLKGGYRLEKLTVMDMFPGTHHIELVSAFVK